MIAVICHKSEKIRSLHHHALLVVGDTRQDHTLGIFYKVDESLEMALINMFSSVEGTLRNWNHNGIIWVETLNQAMACCLFSAKTITSTNGNVVNWTLKNKLQ